MRIKESCVIVISLLQLFPLYSQNPANAFLKLSKPDNDTLRISETVGDKWEAFTVSDGIVRQGKPLLDKIPTATIQSDMPVTSLRVTEIIDTLPEIWRIIDTDEIIDKTETDDADIRIVGFEFYGISQIVSVPKEYGTFHPDGISEKDVSKFRQMLSACKFQRILSDCNKYKVALGYNDWAILKWTQALAQAIYPDNIHSEQEVFVTFIMNQMGLQVRCARANDRLVTLFTCMQNIYARKYLVIDTYLYYLAEDVPSASQLYTYRGNYVKTSRPLDLRITVPIKIGKGISDMNVSKHSSVLESTIELLMSKSLADFYNEYPQLDASIYASAALNSDMINKMKQIIDFRQDKISLVNQMLSFMHLDFKYMVDQEQFGREKPFFFEENFIYPYNDCEDRSIMLSVLLRQVLGLNAILLDYGEHMAVAVNLPEDIRGDHLILNNKKYYVCDPTYIGATIGMSIPRYRNKPVKVHMI